MAYDYSDPTMATPISNQANATPMSAGAIVLGALVALILIRRGFRVGASVGISA